jgi:hypothetical protein
MPNRRRGRVLRRARGLAVFQVLRKRRNETQAFLYAFDLPELDRLEIVLEHHGAIRVRYVCVIALPAGCSYAGGCGE